MKPPLKIVRTLLILLSLLCLVSSNVVSQKSLGKLAQKPLYRDPVFDGAADPVVIWNPRIKRWWMFYTNRRANAGGLNGVTWVHGTAIGIAESGDDGATWKYVGTADIKDGSGIPDVTYWAPDVDGESSTCLRRWCPECLQVGICTIVHHEQDCVVGIQPQVLSSDQIALQSIVAE